MLPLSTPARIAATLVALTGWAGLTIQVVASIEITGSVGGAIWVMLRFFTVLSNLFSAIVFTGVALGLEQAARPRLLGCVAAAMMLVGIVYAALLRGLLDLSGGAALADLLLHSVATVLAPLWWLLFVPKGRLRRGDPLLWALLPGLYYVYGLARGAIDGKYPYPFMDVSTIGWQQTLLNGAVMAAAFVAAGYAMVWFDGRLSRRGPL